MNLKFDCCHGPAVLAKLLFLIALSCSMTLAGTNKSQAIDALVSHYAQYHVFNGTVLVAEAGKVIYSAGHGKANLEWDIELTPSVKFRIGSVTKQFTAMMVMQLVQEKKMRLEDPVAKYLEDFPASWRNRVRIHHLLNHTSGVPNTIEIPGWLEGRYDRLSRTGDFTPIISKLELNFAPGSRMQYSNSGYFLLAAVIEAVTGKPYEQALKTRILDPLDMTRSGNDHQSRIISHKASGYSWSPGGGFEVPAESNMLLLKGSGSMYATVGDLFKWDRALYTETLLGQDHKRLLCEPGLNGAAYGWFVGSMSIEGSSLKPKTVSHGGQLNGFNALITRFVDEQHLVVLLHNKGATDLDALTREIAAILYGVETKASKLPVNFLLMDSMARGDLDKGVQTFLNNPDHYAIRETDVNRLGYQLLAVPLHDHAVRVFQLNTRVFPDSANAHDSLAEAYRSMGNRKQSLLHYRKSLSLNADNHNARKAIGELQGGAPIK